MKKFKLLALGIILFIAGSTRAQVSVNVNIGSPPSWGPSGYAETEYYYYQMFKPITILEHPNSFILEG
jgi:hypothetical protein